MAGLRFAARIADGVDEGPNGERVELRGVGVKSNFMPLSSGASPMRSPMRSPMLPAMLSANFGGVDRMHLVSRENNGVEIRADNACIRRRGHGVSLATLPAAPAHRICRSLQPVDDRIPRMPRDLESCEGQQLWA